MARFEDCIETVLRHEGGFVDNPADPGGATKYGISLRFLQTLPVAFGDVDGDGDVDALDVKLFDRERAIGIYRSFFWNLGRFEEIESPRLATKVFDLAVNMGRTQAWTLAQRAMRAVGKPVAEDGIPGPATVAALNSAPPEAVLVALRSEAAGFYRGLVAAKKERAVFLKGWLVRAYA